MKFGEGPQGGEPQLSAEEKKILEERREAIRSEILPNIPPEMLWVDPEKIEAVNTDREHEELSKELTALMTEIRPLFFGELGRDAMLVDVEKAMENYPANINRLKELLSMRISKEQALLAALERLYQEEGPKAE